MTDTATTPPDARPSRRRRLLSWGLRIAVTGGALAWVFSKTNLSELTHAFGRITVAVGAIAVLLFLANLLVASVRWRILLAAYGSHWRPPLALLFRIYVVALFYNTVLPANIGGDVVRGYVTRRAFPGAAGAYLIVLIERVFGLAGIFLLAAIGLLIRPLAALPHGALVAFVALVAALSASAAPLFGKKLARFLPLRLRSLAEALPVVRAPAVLLVVLALSMGTQALVALTGHVLLVSLETQVTLFDSLTLVPVAMAAAYAPTVAGLGAREAAFVFVFGAIGVSEADAFAASLALFGAQLITALMGGLLHLMAPLPQAEEAKPM